MTEKISLISDSLQFKMYKKLVITMPMKYDTKVQEIVFIQGKAMKKAQSVPNNVNDLSLHLEIGSYIHYVNFWSK